MKTTNPIKCLVLPLGLLLCASSMAQSLSLFEPLEQTGERNERMPALAPPAQAATIPAAGGSAGFSLQSLARFGDEYRGTLRDPNGATVQVRWREGEQVPLPGHAGYAVLGLAQGRLQLQQARPCFPDPAQGITCAAPNVALLSLATRPPLEQPQAPRREGRQQRRNNAPDANAPPVNLNQGQAVVLNENGNTVIFNPANGEAIDPEQLQTLLNMRAQRLRGRLGEQAVQVQPFGIQAESVSIQGAPAGMRVVRTPFGDRLVPDRN